VLDLPTEIMVETMHGLEILRTNSCMDFFIKMNTIEGVFKWLGWEHNIQ
jgi:hypothetical protein